MLTIQSDQHILRKMNVSPLFLQALTDDLIYYRDPVPAFILMDIQSNTLVTYVYSLANDEMEVKKIEFKKSVPEREE